MGYFMAGKLVKSRKYASNPWGFQKALPNLRYMDALCGDIAP